MSHRLQIFYRTILQDYKTISIWQQPSLCMNHRSKQSVDCQVIIHLLIRDNCSLSKPPLWWRVHHISHYATTVFLKILWLLLTCEHVLHFISWLTRHLVKNEIRMKTSGIIFQLDHVLSLFSQPSLHRFWHRGRPRYSESLGWSIWAIGWRDSVERMVRSSLTWRYPLDLQHTHTPVWFWLFHQQARIFYTVF